VGAVIGYARGHHLLVLAEHTVGLTFAFRCIDLSLKSELRCTNKSHARAVGTSILLLFYGEAVRNILPPPFIFTGHSVRGSLIPTSVHTLLSDSKTCVVGYTNGGIAQFDFHGEKLLQMARTSDCDNAGRDSQVNRLAVHPSMPIVITAHQDRKIRIFDMRSGALKASFLYLWHLLTRRVSLFRRLCGEHGCPPRCRVIYLHRCRRVIFCDWR
jgi:hypothetical protein